MSEKELETIISSLDAKHAKRSLIDNAIRICGIIGTILTIGYVGGDWHAWREETTQKVDKLEKYVYPPNLQAQLNQAKALKNKYAPVKGVDCQP